MRIFLSGAFLSEVGALMLSASEGMNNATFLQLAALVLGGGAAAAYISGRQRKKSGEDKASAADDVAHAASEMAGAVKDLTMPLREENARLHGRIQVLQERLAAKAEANADLAVQLANVSGEFEKRRHADAAELATLAAEIVTLQIQMERRDAEIARLKVMAGLEDDRREGVDRREPPNPA